MTVIQILKNNVLLNDRVRFGSPMAVRKPINDESGYCPKAQCQ